MGQFSGFPECTLYKQGARLTLEALFPDFAPISPDTGAGVLDIYDHLEQIYPLDPNGLSNYDAIPWQGWNADYQDQLLAHMLP